MEDGQGLTLHNPTGPPSCVTFLELGRLAKGSITELNKRIKGCLPADCVDQYLGFPWETLSDDLLSDLSVFSQPANAPILKPIQNHLLDALLTQNLTSAGTISVVKARKWLHHHDCILAAITSAFTLTCGIPPRDFQYQSLQVAHDVTKGYSRSFFIIQRTPALGNPHAKQRGTKFRECLWGVPAVLAPPLLYFLGILKPVFSALLQRANIEHPLFDTYIFVRVIPTTARASTSNAEPSRAIELNALLSGSAINRILQEHMKGLQVQVTCGFLRNTFTAVCRQFFPWLAQPLGMQTGTSAMDAQGQHQTATSNAHYGRILVTPRALKIPQERALRYLETSRAIQTLYGLTPPDEELQWTGNGSMQQPAFILGRHHESAALMASRALVCQYYGLGGAGLDAQNRNVEAVKTILQSMPYATCPDEANPVH